MYSWRPKTNVLPVPYAFRLILHLEHYLKTWQSANFNLPSYSIKMKQKMCKRQLYHGIISSKTSSKPNKRKFGYLIQLNKPYLAYFINFVCPHATLTGSNNVILTLTKELWYIRIRRENGICSYESWSQLQNNVLTITKIRRNALCQLYKQNQLQPKDFCALKSCYSNHKSKILKTTSHSFLFFFFFLSLGRTGGREHFAQDKRCEDLQEK